MRADRLLSVLLLLQSRGRMTARDLARRLEVSERTIYRDLNALSTAGVPVYVERGRRGGCALVEGYRTELTGLTDDRCGGAHFIRCARRALLGCADVVEALEPPELREGITSAVARLTALYVREGQAT